MKIALFFVIGAFIYVATWQGATISGLREDLRYTQELHRILANTPPEPPTDELNEMVGEENNDILLRIDSLAAHVNMANPSKAWITDVLSNAKTEIMDGRTPRPTTEGGPHQQVSAIPSRCTYLYYPSEKLAPIPEAPKDTHKVLKK